jgi:hypothetical protein
LPEHGTRQSLANGIIPVGSDKIAKVQLRILEVLELDLMAASVAHATIDEDLQKLVEIPPAFANQLKTAVNVWQTHTDLDVRLKVDGNVIIKETQGGTEVVKRAEMDEYLTDRFAQVAKKLGNQSVLMKMTLPSKH